MVELNLTSIVPLVGFLSEKVFVYLHDCNVPFVRLQVKAMNFFVELNVLFFANRCELHNQGDKCSDDLSTELNFRLDRLLCQMEDLSEGHFILLTSRVCM